VEPDVVEVARDGAYAPFTTRGGIEREVELESGRVVDEDGDPVAQANVQLVRRVYGQGRRRLETVASGLSGDDGEFKIRDVFPGRYILKTDKPPLWISGPVYMGYFGSIPPDNGANRERAPIPAGKPGAKIYNPATAYYGGSNPTPIDISPGQNIPLGAIRMENRPVLHVRGKVAGDPGLLAGARVVQLRTEDASRLWSWNYGADIGKDGSFDVAYIQAANEITIGVYSRKMDILGWTRLAVGQNDVEGVVLNASLAALNGVVRFEGEQQQPDPPKTPMRVGIEAVNSSWLTGRSATVIGDGSFTVAALPPGVYTAWLDLPEGSYLKSVQLNGRDLSDHKIDWRGAEAGLLELIVSRKSAVLEGTLLDDDGKPVSGTVTLVPDPPRPGNSHWYPTARADAAGAFRFPTLTPGSYRLYGWEEIEDTAHWDPDFVQPFESRGQSIELQEGGRATVTVKRIPAAVMRDALRKAGIF
ncbi:MAG: carboxypeptidase-like regulatory domain-containing protein, partial [Acidobacteriia bacterium]|nr:carboxypeptidase-like regulatory domain-containing protein [Terriglobia bacterium]